MGKLCVIFEELENFGVSEWSSISSVLKRYITSTTINIEAKGKDAIQVDNINNYILNSNNDAIRDDDGRHILSPMYPINIFKIKMVIFHIYTKYHLMIMLVQHFIVIC